MANFDVKATLSAEDHLTPVLKSLANAVSTLSSKLSKTNNDIAGSSRNAKNSLGDLVKGVAIGDQVSKAFTRTMEGLGNVLKTGIRFEQFQVAFSTMMGSVGQGNLMLEKLYNFAATTPFEIEEVVNAGKKLMAMGIQATDVESRLRTLGDIAAGVGTEKLGQLILAYGQTQTATRLTGMELRQFTEAGVPLLEELSKISGKSAAEIKYGMERGIIVPSQMVTKALENMTQKGGKFYDLMNKQSRTLGGAWSNLKDSFTLMSSKMGALASTALAPLINNVATFIKNNGQMITSIVLAVIAVVTLGAAVIGIIKVINTLKAASIALNLSMAPLAITLFLIASILGVVVYKAMQNFQNKTKAVTDSVLKNFGGIGSSAQKELSGKAAKAAEDLAKKLEDIDAQVIKANRTFTENLAQIVKTAQDKIKELTADIKEQTEDFAKENKKRLEDFNKTQQELIDGNKKTIAEIEQDLKDSTEKFNDKNAEELADFTRTQNELTTRHQRKVRDIQKQIDEELEYGWLANDEKIADLRQTLADENADYDSQFTENKSKYDEDTAARIKENEKKKADLQTKLAEEKAEFETRIAENKLKYEEDTLNAKTEHDKKMLDLQTRLNAENELLTKHSADIVAIKDVQLLDEIELLKRSHQEELREFENQRVEAVKASKKQGEDMALAGLQGQKDIFSLNTGFLDSVGADIGESMGKAMKDAFLQAIKDFFLFDIPMFVAKIIQFFSKLWEHGIKGGKDNNKGLGQLFKDAYNESFGGAAKFQLGGGIQDPTGILFNPNARGTSYWEGGPTLVGERGPEIVNLPRGSEVIPNHKIGNMGTNLTVNIYGNINNSAGYTPSEIAEIINRQVTLSSMGVY